MTAVSGAKEVSWPRMPISLNRRPFAYTSRSIGPRTVCKVRMTGVPPRSRPEHVLEFDVLRCILFWVEDREMTQATSSDDHGVRELNGRLDQVGLQECITDESGHLQARANEARVQGGRAKWCLLSCMCIPRFKLDLHGARGSTNMADGLSVDGWKASRREEASSCRKGREARRIHHHRRSNASPRPPRRRGTRGRWHRSPTARRPRDSPWHRWTSVRRTLRSNEHDPPGRSPSVKGPSERHGRRTQMKGIRSVRDDHSACTVLECRATRLAIRFQWTGRMSSENMLETRSTLILAMPANSGTLARSSSGSIDGRTAPDR